MNIGLGIGIPFNRSQIWLSLFDPSKLFTAGVNGVWYDPSDITTLYRDAAGTLPVTAVEQPVGLMLDKSKGLVLGPELVAPINFTSGWSSSGAAVTFDNPSSFTAAGVANVFRTYFTVGVWYKVVVKATFTGGIVLYNSNTATNQIGPGYIASGTEYTFYFLAAATQLNIRATSAAIVNIDNISVRELPGNHAFNPSGNSANFPVLSARYNLLTNTEDFGSVWSAIQVSTTANSFTNNGTNSRHYVNQYITTQANVPHTICVEFKKSTVRYVVVGVYLSGTEHAGVGVDLDTFQITGVGAVGTTLQVSNAKVETTQDGFLRVSASVVSSGTTLGITIGSRQSAFVSGSAFPIYIGSTSETTFVRNADLRVANDALNQPAYQRVNTATDYDTVGFKPYLRFNDPARGTNNWLQTNSIDFTATDKMTVFAGVRKLSDVQYQMIVELSTLVTANNGSFSVLSTSGLSGVNADKIGVVSRGTNTVNYDVGSKPASANYVLCVSTEISTDTLITRVNGVQAASSTTDQGTGNFGNYPLYIGARAGSSLWFNGRLYGLIVRGAQSTDLQIADTEKYVNSKTLALDWRDVTDSSSFRWNSATASPDAS